MNDGLAKLTADGQLDTAFGTDGLVSLPMGASVADLPDSGFVVVSGSITASGATDYAISRYTAGGQLDTAFGTDGTDTGTLPDLGVVNSTAAVGTQSILTSDGQVIVAAGLSNVTTSTADDQFLFAVDPGDLAVTPTPAPTPTPTPTPASTVTAAVVRSTLPTSVVAGQKGAADTVRLMVMNSGAARQTATVQLVAVSTADGADTVLSTHRMAVRASVSKAVGLSIRPTALAAGSYTLSVRSTDAAGNVSTTAGPSLTVATATASLAVAIAPAARGDYTAGEAYKFTVAVTNTGNVRSSGPLVVTLGGMSLSDDNLVLPKPFRTVTVRHVTIPPDGGRVRLHLHGKVLAEILAVLPVVTVVQGSATATTG